MKRTPSRRAVAATAIWPARRPKMTCSVLPAGRNMLPWRMSSAERLSEHGCRPWTVSRRYYAMHMCCAIFVGEETCGYTPHTRWPVLMMSKKGDEERAWLSIATPLAPSLDEAVVVAERGGRGERDSGAETRRGQRGRGSAARAAVRWSAGGRYSLHAGDAAMDERQDSESKREGHEKR